MNDSRRGRRRSPSRGRGGRKEMSPERKKRREFRFDSPPKEHEISMSILSSAAGVVGGMANAHSILQSLTQMAIAQASKVDRKLYVGNLPKGITTDELMKVLNEELIKLKANLEEGDPVVGAWLSSDTSYAFVEFRTAEEANSGFKLNNHAVLGHPLKVGRPKSYMGAATGLSSLIGTSGLGIANAIGINANLCNPMLGGRNMKDKYQVCPPTRILVLKNLIKSDGSEVMKEEEFEDIHDDIKDESSKYGKVVSVTIPRPDLDGTPTTGCGKIFVEFASVRDAMHVRRCLRGRKYHGRYLEMSYHPEDAYMARDFSPPEKVILEVKEETEEKKEDGKNKVAVAAEDGQEIEIDFAVPPVDINNPINDENQPQQPQPQLIELIEPTNI